jgi:hypothetical protein
MYMVAALATSGVKMRELRVRVVATRLCIKSSYRQFDQNKMKNTESS